MRFSAPQAVLLGVSLLVMLPACKRAPTPAPAPSASVVAFVAPSAAPDAGPTPDPREEAERVLRYRRAMTRGRTATRKRDFAAATGAFDEALAAKPDDARALSERGYAKLLATDLDGASRDLERARAGTGDRELAAQIWFNLGLVAERSQREDDARLAFARSADLKPTKAAKDKLAGKTLCPVRIARSHDSSSTYAGWLALWKGLADELPNLLHADEKPPATDEEAKAALGVGECGKACIATFASAHYGWGDRQSLALVVPGDGGKLQAFSQIAEGFGGRCHGPPTAMVKGLDPVHVAIDVDESEAGLVCLNEKTGELEDWSPEMPEDRMCQSACVNSARTEIDRIFDAKAGEELVRVEQVEVHAGVGDKGRRAVPVSVEGDAVQVKGGSCDLRIPLRAP